MNLHWLTFMGKNVNNMEKLMQVWIVNDAGLKNTSILSSGNIVNEYCCYE